MKTHLYIILTSILGFFSIQTYAGNLIITDEWFVPINMTRGETYYVEFTVKNDGIFSITTNFYVSLNLSSNTTYEVGDTYLTDIYVTNDFSAYEEYTVSANITIPCYHPTGAEYLLAGADATDLVDEGAFDEDDNTKAVWIDIDGGIDLTPNSYSLSDYDLNAGDNVTATFSVSNMGGTASGSFHVGFYLSDNNVLDAGIDYDLGYYSMSSISACSNSGTYTKTLSIPDEYCTDNYYLFMWIDDDLVVGEIFDNNNFQYYSIDVVGDAPSIPTGLDAYSETEISFTADWNTVTGANNYRLDVSTNASFTDILDDYNDLYVASSSKSVTGLNCETNYYFRVRSEDDCGESGNSLTFTATTDNCCDAPSAPTALPAYSITDFSFTADWNSVAGADNYRLDVSSNASFTAMLPGYNNLYVLGSNQIVTGLNCESYYYYRVRSENDCGVSSNSSTITAITDDCCDLPLIPFALPATAVTLSTFTANWIAGIGATGYRLDVANDNSFIDILPGYNDIYVSGTNKVVSGLDCENTYYYRIRSENACGESANSFYITTTTIDCVPIDLDLEVENHWISVDGITIGNVTQDMVIDIQHSIRNNGINSSNTSVTSFWFSEDDIFDGAPTDHWLGEVSMPVIEAGNIEFAQCNIKIPADVSSGSAFILFAADGAENNDEGVYENNNQFFLPINVVQNPVPFLIQSPVPIVYSELDPFESGIARNYLPDELLFEKCNSNPYSDIGCPDPPLYTEFVEGNELLIPSELIDEFEDWDWQWNWQFNQRGWCSYQHICAAGIGHSKNSCLYQDDRLSGDFNLGYTINYDYNSPVLAVESGNITDDFPNWNSNDKQILIEHSGLFSPWYSGYQIIHEGITGTVEKGAEIAKINDPDGTVPPHLHFAVYYNQHDIDANLPDKLISVNRDFNTLIYDPFGELISYNYTEASGFLIGSLISNGKLYLKRQGADQFEYLTSSDERGLFTILTIPAINTGDSIKVAANGYKSISTIVDSYMINSKKLNIPLFKDNLAANDITNPRIEILSGNIYLNEPSVQLKITGDNFVNYDINLIYSNFDSEFEYTNLITNNLPSDSIVLVSIPNLGNNELQIIFKSPTDTITINKSLYFEPSPANFYNIDLIINPDLMGLLFYLDGVYIKNIQSLTENIAIINGRHSLTFHKLGYLDTTIEVSAAATITVNLLPMPELNYTPSDSIIFNFISNDKVQYWHNLTLYDSLQQSIVSCKQYNDSFPLTGLIPVSRNFEFKHINDEWSNISIAAVLDQIDNLNKDSIYLLQIYDNNIFNKIQFTADGIYAGFDSIVQKLSFNHINFNEGEANTESVIIMKKQAPIVNPSLDISIFTTDSLKLPFSYFFLDPDSIENDLEYEIISISANLNAEILGDSLLIYPDVCWEGTGFIELQAKHDWLTQNATNNIYSLPLTPPSIFADPSEIICIGGTTILTSNTPDIYWNTGDTTTSITIEEEGSYFVTSTNICGTDTSNIITVTFDPSPVSNFNFTLTGLTANFINESTDATNFYWSFGDGGTSTEINPNHAYMAPGVYYVELTASDSCSSQTYGDSIEINFPDLTGAIIYNTPIVQIGDSLHITFSITNIGLSAAKKTPSGFVNRTKLSNGDCLFIDDYLLEAFYIDSIQPGQTITYNKSYYIDGTYPFDTFYVLLAPNAAEVVVETTYDNNKICSEPNTVIIIDSTCTFTLPVTAATFSTAAATGSFTFSTLYNCDWIIESYPSWVTITSDLSGTGSGFVTYNVESNTSCETRIDSIIISGQSYIITQEGNIPTYILSSYSASISSTGGTGSIYVTSSEICEWYASCPSSWVHINTDPYMGSGEFSYTVDTNCTGGPRSTTITIAGLYFSLSQAQNDVDCSVGILNINGEEIKIYPNPTSDFVTIECSKQLTIANIYMTSQTGQLIENAQFYKNGDCIYTSNMGNLSSGAYYINILIDNKIYQYQIILSH